MATYTADPTSVLDYPVDWTGFLDVGETLTGSTFTVQAGITQATPPPSFTAEGIAVIWLTGGTPNTLYRITNHITTSAGRQHDETFNVYVTDL